MAPDWTTARRRLRRLADPVALAKRIASRRRHRHAIDREIRTHIDGHTEKAMVTTRRPIAFPALPEELKKSELFNTWWYYSAELMPGLIVTGLYPNDVPMLPRVMMRRSNLEGMSCLDLGPMEGLMPVLMKRRGASRVLAVDAIDGSADKMEALKHYFSVDFDFRVVGLMYDLYRKLDGEPFDLIDCSGLLYHVFSPISVLAGLRPLLKRNGLLIVSTAVVNDPGYAMEFNNAARMQEESNTFWYLSIPLLEYTLRYLALQPIDCTFYWFSNISIPHIRLGFDRPAGYMSVVCRAVDDVLPTDDDAWMRRSARASWEHRGLCDLEAARRQPVSSVHYNLHRNADAWRPDTDSLNLWKAIETQPELCAASRLEDSHTLMLDHRS